MTVLLVALGAAVGAPLRYFVDRAVQYPYGSDFPWGTLIVNVLGSALLGFLTGAAAAGDVPAWVVTATGVGFCGSFTTYSAFGYESVQLAQQGRSRYALLNTVLSISAGVGTAALGVALAGAVWR